MMIGPGIILEKQQNFVIILHNHDIPLHKLLERAPVHRAQHHRHREYRPDSPRGGCSILHHFES